MHHEREKWNRKHRDGVGPEVPAGIIARFIDQVPPGRALDIAAGRGRNALYLARRGFQVDAVDISDAGLNLMAARHPRLQRICADLDRFDIPAARYQLIINIRYLNRRLFPYIVQGLAPGGFLIFETFLESGGYGDDTARRPSCRDHLLRENELLYAFLPLHVRYYAEHGVRRPNWPGPLASLVAVRRVCP